MQDVSEGSINFRIIDQEEAGKLGREFPVLLLEDELQSAYLTSNLFIELLIWGHYLIFHEPFDEGYEIYHYLGVSPAQVEIWEHILYRDQ